MAGLPGIILNPDLHVDALRLAFKKSKRLHIPDIINLDAAEALERCLGHEIAWNITYNDDEGQKDLFASAQRQMTPQEWQNLHRMIIARAREEKFQYMYGNFAVGDIYKQNLIDDLYVGKFYEFVNSEPFLGFMRNITGFDDIVCASQQATAYASGHFLTDHNDFDPKKDRKIAYVFNMTRKWRPEWGGYLQFLDDKAAVIDNFAPSFNALNFFAVPQRHVVTQVSTFAGAVRYSLTGWLMTKK